MAKIAVKSRVLQQNDRTADAIGEMLGNLGIRSCNLIGSPGSGKTALLEATLPRLENGMRCAVVEGVKVDGLVEQIAAEEGDHVGCAAAVLSEVEDQGVGVGHEGHGRRSRRSSLRAALELVELDVTHVAGKDLDLGESVVVFRLGCHIAGSGYALAGSGHHD